MCCTANMSEDALIRRKNLRALGKSAGDLVVILGSGYSYWAAMLDESSDKAFGEKIARRIEDGFGLPRGSMDIQDGVTSEMVRPPAWPFALVDQDRYERLSPEAKGAVQARMLDEIDRLERQSQGVTAGLLAKERRGVQDRRVNSGRKRDAL